MGSRFCLWLEPCPIIICCFGDVPVGDSIPGFGSEKDCSFGSCISVTAANLSPVSF